MFKQRIEIKIPPFDFRKRHAPPELLSPIDTRFQVLLNAVSILFVGFLTAVVVR